MEIRKAVMEDLPAMQEIFARARKFMAENGNPTQWGTTNPTEEQLRRDIESGGSYVCEEEGRILATFYFAIGDDEAYASIQNGAWLNDKPYGVVHRIASSGERTGAGAFCLQWAYDQCKNLRIDTHCNNLPMRGLLQKLGFLYCGTIVISDGTQRIAYQKL